MQNTMQNTMVDNRKEKDLEKQEVLDEDEDEEARLARLQREQEEVIKKNKERQMFLDNLGNEIVY